jgi:hypothetical protein
VLWYQAKRLDSGLLAELRRVVGGEDLEKEEERLRVWIVCLAKFGG